MADPVVSPEILKAVGEWRTETLVIIGVILLIALLIWLAARFLTRRADRQAKAAEAAAKAARAATFVGSISELVRSIRDMSAGSVRMETAVTDSVTAIRALTATLRGAINPADSRKIIESELWAVAKECARAYQMSLRENHFNGREDEVRDKMRRATSRLFDRARAKLESFDMGIKPVNFFETRGGDGTRYDTVDAFWTQMERLYRNPVQYIDLKAAVERDRLVYDLINSAMRDELIRGYKRADQVYSPAGHSSQVFDVSGDDESASRPGSLA